MKKEKFRVKWTGRDWVIQKRIPFWWTVHRCQRRVDVEKIATVLREAGHCEVPDSKTLRQMFDWDDVFPLTYTEYVKEWFDSRNTEKLTPPKK